jgi:ABC-type nickel/cobalt efflux system permease component RcnA
MRRTLSILGLVLAAILLLLWLTGGLAALQAQVFDGQRQVQSALAAAVRAIKTGQPGALAGLLGVCFTYGVLHAAGPGHGKLLIGGYGVARRVPVLRLSALALAASLAQSAVAVGLVYAGVAVLGWTRADAEGVAEDIMAPVGLALGAGVGLWLVLRGWRGLRAGWHADAQAHPPHHDHHHGHHHTHAAPDAACEVCGHAHGPSLEQVDGLRGWRDTAALIAGIAMRPCSGALFLLILTWQLGIGAAGVAGAFAMGAGTATVTIGVALLAVWAREGALASLSGTRITRALPWFEILAGCVVTLAALSLLARSL